MLADLLELYAHDRSALLILRRDRRRGVGVVAAAHVWRRFPVAGRVRVLERHGPALAFWVAPIGAFARTVTEEARTDGQQRTWQVFSFPAPGRSRSRRRRGT